MIDRAKLQHILEYAKQQRHVGLHCKVPPEDMVEIVEAAMLQDADQAPVKQPSSNSIVGWLRADYKDDNRGLRGNAPLFVLGKKDPSSVWGLDYIPLAGNTPVIPDGWKLAPVDATRAMIDAARRVEEDGYDAMHKAMIAAAPQLEMK